MFLKHLDNGLSLLKILPNKKLSDFRKRILKDLDIIAVYNDKRNLDFKKINFKNTNNFNYFIGVVKIEGENYNELNLLIEKTGASKRFKTDYDLYNNKAKNENEKKISNIIVKNYNNHNKFRNYSWGWGDTDDNF